MASGRKSDGVGEIMTFHPTMEEFQDFIGYIKHMETQGAHKYGIAKIVPPKEWKPRREPLQPDLSNIADRVIQSPIAQRFFMERSNSSIYTVLNCSKPNQTVGEFAAKALRAQSGLNFHEVDEIERKYWRSLSTTTTPVIYGADVSGTLTDPDVELWNCAKLPSILEVLDEDYNTKIEGVNTPYLYYGSWKTTFATHTEDMDLYSINYLHMGAPKFWYSLAPAYARKFERTVANSFFQEFKRCPGHFRHKGLLFSPHWFKFYSIPYNKIVQREGDIMITFPMGYHWGFNMGLNVAESTNFATERWIEYGKRCTRCVCEHDRVNISMEAFVRRFQPNQYEDWLIGKDYGRHPIAENDRLTYAPAPSLEDLVCTRDPSEPCQRRIEELEKLQDAKLAQPNSSKSPSRKTAMNQGSKRILTSKRQSTAVKLDSPDSKKMKDDGDASDATDVDEEDDMYRELDAYMTDTSDEEFVLSESKKKKKKKKSSSSKPESNRKKPRKNSVSVGKPVAGTSVEGQGGSREAKPPAFKVRPIVRAPMRESAPEIKAESPVKEESSAPTVPKSPVEGQDSCFVKLERVEGVEGPENQNEAVGVPREGSPNGGVNSLRTYRHRKHRWLPDRYESQPQAEEQAQPQAEEQAQPQPQMESTQFDEFPDVPAQPASYPSPTQFVSLPVDSDNADDFDAEAVPVSAMDFPAGPAVTGVVKKVLNQGNPKHDISFSASPNFVRVTVAHAPDSAIDDL